VAGRSALRRTGRAGGACAIGRIARAGAVAASLLAHPGLCQAVAAPAGSAADDETAAGEILVTANKRVERAQDVPSSLWVATARQIDRAQIRDFDDLARVDPALTITKTTQPGNNSINIRGIGTYAFSIATRPSVSVVVDDVPQAFQAQAFRELADVASIEIYRGPQSTLFGTSATAGVVSIRTAPPTATPTAGGRVGLTSDGERRASGFMSGPLAPGLLVRLAASANRYRGGLYNVHDGRWVNGQSGVDLRAKLLWNATDDLTITAAPYFDKARSTCCATAYYAVSPGVSFGSFGGIRAPQGAILDGIVPGRDNRRISADVDPKGDATEGGASLRAEWRIGDHRLTAIGFHGRYRLRDLQDTDGTAFDWSAAVPGAPRGGSANGGWFGIRSTSQELRLTSPDAGRFRYVAGLFYTHVRARRSFVRGSNLLGPFGASAAVPPTTSAFSTYFAEARDTNYAVYGQSSWDLAPRISLSTGLRLNRDAIGYGLVDRSSGVRYGMPRCSTATPSGLTVSTCDTLDALSGRAALQYRPDPRVMIFASYDRGYKGAAYDLTSTYTTRTPVAQPGPYQGLPVADAVAARQPIRPETVDAFQIGVKTQPFAWLTWNLTVYQEVFHDFQAQSRDELTRQNILNSIRRVTSRGAELELAAEMAPRLSLSAYGSYNDARIRAFPNATCYSNQTVALGCIGGQQDLSGKRVPNAPRWKASVSGQHDERIGRDLDLVFTLNWSWQSRIVENLLQDPDSVQGAYGILNLGVELKRGATRFRLSCANLLDKSFALNRGRDGNWNINPYGALPGPVSDAIKWTPGRDSRRYVRAEFSIGY
jgi:iron complex outermembrane receptor protein